MSISEQDGSQPYKKRGCDPPPNKNDRTNDDSTNPHTCVHGHSRVHARKASTHLQHTNASSAWSERRCPGDTCKGNLGSPRPSHRYSDHSKIPRDTPACLKPSSHSSPFPRSTVTRAVSGLELLHRGPPADLHVGDELEATPPMKNTPGGDGSLPRSLQKRFSLCWAFCSRGESGSRRAAVGSVLTAHPWLACGESYGLGFSSSSQLVPRQDGHVPHYIRPTLRP